MTVRGWSLAGVLSLQILVAPAVPEASTPDEARRDTIAWLESAQNDLDWAAGPLEPLVRAEVLNALAAAGRCGTVQAQRISG